MSTIKSQSSSDGGSSSIISFGFGSRKKKQPDDSTLLSSESAVSNRPSSVLKNTSEMSKPPSKTLAVRHDGFGYQPDHHTSDVKISSLSYLKDESEASRAYKSSQHYKYRGTFWNEGKREIMVRYFQLALVGLGQGTVAYFVNLLCRIFTDIKFDAVKELIGRESWFAGFLSYFSHQLIYAAWASMFVMIEPMSGGSGIPEVKIFLNGIDLPRINDLKTGLCKILGVVGSVSAGLPVGKEGPMVHSGAVVSSLVSQSSVKDDKTRRDFVACGAAAGVCTAFSAPIGGVLFSLEEGASYWSQAVTFRTFFCSMCSIATLYSWNAVGAQFGKVGLDKLFSFGNFPFEGMDSSYSIWELLVFVFIGCMGGLIGAVFNNTNEKLTHWRIKHVNHTKHRRFFEVLCISAIVSIIGYFVPFFFYECMELPDTSQMDEKQLDLVDLLVQFGCADGKYHPIASLFFVDGNDAIKLLFHMHVHVFPVKALLLFFFFYISLATITYGIAVPSGLFVPSLLSGAAFGRILGNVAYKIAPHRVAFSNTYSLIGAAAVLGGMARMTISLTVILLESTGNEQFVLPLMITLFCSRIVGCLFNDDLYHIHIHLKAGVQFLDHQLRNISGHHDLFAGHIMSKDVVFFRPIERVGTVLDILTSCDHSCFPVVDTEDRDVLYGTTSRHVVATLLQQRAFGLPSNTAIPLNNSILQNHIRLNPNSTYLPLVPYKVLERIDSAPKSVDDLNIDDNDRELFIDLRPYCNTAPSTILETTSVQRAYETFRTLGLRMLVVTNRYNQCVGTITRDDLTVENLSQDMITKGKNL